MDKNSKNAPRNASSKNNISFLLLSPSPLPYQSSPTSKICVFMVVILLCSNFANAALCTNTDGAQLNNFQNTIQNKCTCGNIECLCTDATTQTMSISSQVSDTSSTDTWKPFLQKKITTDLKLISAVVKWKDQG